MKNKNELNNQTTDNHRNDSQEEDRMKHIFDFYFQNRPQNNKNEIEKYVACRKENEDNNVANGRLVVHRQELWIKNTL